MSEKRFELRGLGVFDTENDNKSLSRVDVVELLNELDDERMMYKTTIDKRIVELQEENERLKKENECLKMENDKVDIKTLLKLLVCIATSDRGWTDEERLFIKLLERELFPDE